jgi:hypothetical protein
MQTSSDVRRFSTGRTSESMRWALQGCRISSCAVAERPAMKQKTLSNSTRAAIGLEAVFAMTR